MLEVENLTVSFETDQGRLPIVAGIDLRLGRGEALGLVGESGCGKSMTALAIMGLLPGNAQADGSIRLDGQELLELDEAALCDLRGRRVAMIFQEPMTALNPVQSIGQQVAEGPRLHLGLSRHDSEKQAARLLDRVGLPPARFPLSLFPHQLSGGQRQRVVIAVALACDPELIIADEPTTALDVTIQSQILDLLMDIVENEQRGLLLITHDLGVVAEITDHVAIMYAGSLVEKGETKRVFERMAHPYTHGLFAALPGLDLAAEQASERARLTTIPGRVPDPYARPAGCCFAPRCHLANQQCRQEPSWTAIAGQHAVSCFHPRSSAR